MFDQASPYKGKVTAYDAPIYIADAALYLMTTQPDLGIKDPYALNQEQFDAAVALLKQQKPIIGEYWSDYPKSAGGVRAGHAPCSARPGRSSPTWPTANKAHRSTTVLPEGGLDRWSDTWMVVVEGQAPQLHVHVDGLHHQPEVQAQVADYFGEAPANPKACDLITDDPTHCDVYQATDEAFAERL